jgi:nucleoside-diphosphate-sugar epimerase
MGSYPFYALEETEMRVFLAGGTGAVGRRLVPQLVERGHEVTATTRHAERTDLLRSLGAEPVVVDGLDAVGIGKAVARAQPEAIVHQMTALSGNPDFKHFDRWFALTNRLRTEGTEHLLAAAAAVGATRFIAQSYMNWANTGEGAPLKTEDAPLEPNPAKAHTETLAAIRALEESVVSAPLDGIALRYGGLYGPGASESMVEMVRKHKVPIVGDGAGVWSWLHVDDAASAVVAALEHGERGIYNIVDDDPAPVAVWLPYLASAVGAKSPMHVPTWLGRLAIGDVGVKLMTEARGSSNRKAKRELLWQPAWSSWREGFRYALSDEQLASEAA